MYVVVEICFWGTLDIILLLHFNWINEKKKEQSQKNVNVLPEIDFHHNIVAVGTGMYTAYLHMQDKIYSSSFKFLKYAIKYTVFNVSLQPTVKKCLLLFKHSINKIIKWPFLY